MAKRYRYKSKVLFVKAYEADNATAYATFFTDKKGIDRAYVTDGLSLGHTSAEKAQYELDQFAAAKGLKAVQK